MLYSTLIYTIPIFLFSLLLIRKAIYTIFDPILMSIFALSASMGVLLDISYRAGLVTTAVTGFFVGSHLAFLFGILLGNRVKVRFKHERLSLRYLRPSYVTLLLLVTLLVLGATFLFMLLRVGLVITQSDILTARTTLLTGGFGILRRILEAGTVLAFALLLIKNHYYPISRIKLIVILTMLVTIMLSLGAKSFLYTFYALYAYYLIFLDKNRLKKFGQKSKLLAIVSIIAVLIGAMGILLLDTIRSDDISMSESVKLAMINLANRIAGFGDIGYLFFENFAFEILKKTPFDYVRYILNDVLGFLRISEYQRSPGAEIYAIVTQSANPEGFGPNAQVYFVGFMYFRFFGILYSFIIGWLISCFRRMILFNFRHTNREMLIFILANYFILPVAMDIQYALLQLFNIIIIGGPIFVLTYVMYLIVTESSPVRIFSYKPVEIVR